MSQSGRGQLATDLIWLRLRIRSICTSYLLNVPPKLSVNVYTYHMTEWLPRKTLDRRIISNSSHTRIHLISSKWEHYSHAKNSVSLLLLLPLSGFECCCSRISLFVSCVCKHAYIYIDYMTRWKKVLPRLMIFEKKYSNVQHTLEHLTALKAQNFDK